MSVKDDRSNTDRRSFLKFAGLGTLAGGAALVTAKSAAEAAVNEAPEGVGYRETEHVKTFYKTARF